MDLKFSTRRCKLRIEGDTFSKTMWHVFMKMKDDKTEHGGKKRKQHDAEPPSPTNSPRRRIRRKLTNGENLALANSPFQKQRRDDSGLGTTEELYGSQESEYTAAQVDAAETEFQNLKPY